jgi:class 3 adenylate cyclase/TolB-like protein/tetratricopeptide (TPR) repeat protein
MLNEISRRERAGRRFVRGRNLAPMMAAQAVAALPASNWRGCRRKSPTMEPDGALREQLEKPMRRRLATILVCDVVDSTVAMEADEETAVSLFARCLDMIAKTVRKRDGRVFSTAGDALLAEFASPVEALRAAMEARTALVSIDGASIASVRFGLHVADVMEVGSDLRGDGVNLAARIQGTGAAGDICVSAILVDQVRRGSPCTFEELGEFELKGVSEPVRVFRVTGTMERFPFQRAPTRKPPKAELRPYSVAVAPFRTVGPASEEQAFLAEGLSEDLILELSRHRRLFVSSRSASFAAEDLDATELGRQLGVRYVVSGSVRRAGPNVRLNLTLNETETGRALWSDRVEILLEKISGAMDDMTARIAATVFGRIEQGDMSAARRRPSTTLNAYESYLRGIEHHRLGQLTDSHVRAAVEWFGRAMAEDPDFAAPMAMQVCAASQLSDFDWDWGIRQVSKALELDPHDPEVNRIMGSIKMKQGDFAASRHFHQRALELSPNDAYIVARCAAFHVYAGEPERGLELLRRAEELDPFLPVWCVEEKVAAFYASECWPDALTAARSLPYQTRRSRLYSAACLAAMGQEREARRLVEEARAENPGLATDFVEANENFMDLKVLDTLLDRLRSSGLPEPSGGDRLELPPRALG